MKKNKKIKKSSSVSKAKKQSPIINIKVVGVGGGGNNAVSRMSKNFGRKVEFIAINTDHQDLDNSIVNRKVYIGRNLTRGLGTGMNPELGRQAAEENRSEIAETLEGADLIFLAAGLGGGTGTGAAPVVAEIAKQTGALTVAFVTRPFGFEGSQRDRIAQEGLIKLKDKVDSLIVVPNDRIFAIISKETPLHKAFEAIDDVLRNALSGIVDMIVSPGLVNLDFADLRTVMENAGPTIVGLGVASGPERATEAIQKALNSPLLETSADGARGVVLAISGGRDLRMNEINEAARIVTQTADQSAKIIFGAYRDRSIPAKQLKVVLIAAGFNGMNGGGNLFKAKEISGSSMLWPKPKQEIISEPDLKNDSSNENKSVNGNSKNGKEDLKNNLTKEDESKKKFKEDKESNIWDIPTFLRRKKR